MKLDFAFKHMETSEAMIEHATKGMQRLERYEMYKQPHAHWIFSVQRHEHFAEVVLNGAQVHISASAVSDDMYRSIDLAIDKLERQLSRKKEKVQYHKHPNFLEAQAQLHLEEHELEEESQSLPVTGKKTG